MPESAWACMSGLTGAGDRMALSAWALDSPSPPVRAVIADSHARARELISRASAQSPVEEHLALAADTFVIAGPDVVAGYPWFGSWSRDTMISFEGLFLETGRADEGRELLLAYGQRISQGMLSNTADTGSLEFNTVDATLWFVHAIDRYLHRSDDTDLMATAIPWLKEILAWHIRGTRYGIHVDGDGLLAQGQEHLALTWMDARVGDFAVTPRIGKPVEVNALWINALAVANEIFGRLGRSHPEFEALEVAARRSFARRFLASGSGGLPDVVDGPSGDDVSIRPNQVLAMSLPHGRAWTPCSCGRWASWSPGSGSALCTRATRHTGAGTQVVLASGTWRITRGPYGPGSSARTSMRRCAPAACTVRLTTP